MSAAVPLKTAPARSTPQKKRLGDRLIEQDLIEPWQLERALEHQRTHGGRLGSTLVHMGFLEEAALDAQLADQLGLKMADVESLNPAEALLRRIPQNLVERYEAVPLAMERDTIVLGMTDPRNYQAIDDLRFVLGCSKLDVRLVTEGSFKRFVSTRYATTILMDQIVEDEALDETTAQEGVGWDEGEFDPETDMEGLGEGTSIIRLVNYILKRAVEQRASDIHIEPYETFSRVRFRVDGSLFTVMTPPQRVQRPMASRIKILSGMDISERRRPQDGQMTMDYKDENLCFRVSCLPTVFGEKTVIRLLKKEAHLADLNRLGFRKDQLAMVRKTIRLGQGLVLVTGPTGSGKTTTLHAMLNDINDPDINIVTAEDPVEQALPGINHVQILEKGGTTFPAALRSMLRQDPDVIFVGEMRDTEVSKIAIKASLTGHLVMSTLHTNGVIETFNRLIDMGIEPYLLASCLKLVLAQRLLRRVCGKCSLERPIPEKIIEEFELTREQAESALYREAKGCSECLDTGYRGRVAVYESMVPTDAVKDVLRAGGDETALFAIAREMGMVTMYDAGIARALAGETTFEEVTRVLADSGD